MIHRVDDRVEVSGPITMQVAADVLEEGCAALDSTASVFDLSGVTEVDSSGLAVMFAWMREARERGAPLRFENTPANLLNLAVVYDVAEFLPRN